MPATKKAASTFAETFARLRNVMKKYERRLQVLRDTPKEYYVNSGYSEKWKKEVCFGAVRIGKNYVSYYLMPIYACPDLLDELPDELKARKQGKSCFHFRTIDDAQLKAMTALTKASFERWDKAGLVNDARSPAEW